MLQCSASMATVMTKKRGLTSSTQPEDMPNKKNKPCSIASSIYIPTDLVFSDILTRLPAKILCRFKSVCRLWCSAISTDAVFARDQSRHKSITSSGVVYCQNQVSLAFLPTLGTSIGVPDSSLGLKDTRFEILASTNGILLLGIRHQSKLSLYVCNPATGDGQYIPMLVHDLSVSFGVFFDPSASPEHYKLVVAHRRHSSHPQFLVEYTFEVFSSSTNQWTASSTATIGVPSFWRPSKAVFAHGLLYWHCTSFMLSYDACKDAARVMNLPPVQSLPYMDDIGVWENKLTCTRRTDECVQVWVMKEKDEWELRHCINMEEVTGRNRDVFGTFVHPSPLRKRTVWVRLLRCHWVLPMAYEGGKNVHLRMRAEGRGKESKEVILECDLETKRVVVLAESQVKRSNWMRPFFSYRNSLVALPRINYSNGPSADLFMDSFSIGK